MSLLTSPASSRSDLSGSRRRGAHGRKSPPPRAKNEEAQRILRIFLLQSTEKMPSATEPGKIMGPVPSHAMVPPVMTSEVETYLDFDLDLERCASCFEICAPGAFRL